MNKVGVIGAGSLGTALAQTIAKNVDTVYLHLRREELAKTLCLNCNSYLCDSYSKFIHEKIKKTPGFTGETGAFWSC